MKKRKVFAATASAALVASAVVPAATLAASFTDISKLPAEEQAAINALADAGILNGKGAGLFDPYAQMKRSEIAKIVSEILELDPKNAPSAEFSDVKKGYWAEEYINAAVAAKVLEGKGDGKFDPETSMKRAELAQVVVKALNLKLVEGKEHKFEDIPSNYWGKDAIEILYSNGLIKGKSETKFAPEEKMQRNHVALLLKRALDQKTPDKPSVITSVAATTETVDIAKNEDQLEFTVNNGIKVTVQDLKNEGYDVKFVSSEDKKDPADPDKFIVDSDTGEVTFADAKEGDKFKYQVVVTKNKETFHSQVQTVKAIDSFNVANTINVAKITVNGVENKSGTLSQKPTDATIQFAEISYTNKDRVKKDLGIGEFGDVKFTSSNPEVIIVDKEGKIHLVNTGKATITVEVAGLKKQIPLTVVNETLKPTKVTADYTNVKLAPGSQRDVEFTVLNQYGDPYEGATLEAQPVKNSKGEVIGTMDDTTATDKKGKATGTLKATEPGKGDLHIVAVYGDDNKKTSSLLKLPVEITGTKTVETLKLEKVDAKANFELDNFVGAYDKPEDQKLVLRVNEYSTTNVLLDKVEFTDHADNTVTGTSDGETITVSTEPSDVVKLEADDGDIKITPLKKGTATVLVKKGDLTIASQKITVVDTTPEITAISFNAVNTVTELADLPVKDVIDVNKVTVKNKIGVLRLDDTGQFLYLDKNNDKNFADADGDIKIGTVTVTQSGDFDQTIGFVADGKLGTFTKGDDGMLIIKVTGETGEKKVFTKAVNVSIPK